LDAADNPKFTEAMLEGVAPSERPNTNTEYPPVVAPVDGTSDVTVGVVTAGSKYVNGTVDVAGMMDPLENVAIETGPMVGVGMEPVVHRTSVGDT
jgi:hypothetical protein